MVTTYIGTNTNSGRSVTVQADGKILVAGVGYNGAGININPDFALVRYNTDGSLDTSFSTDGMVTTAIGTSYDYGYSVTVQADGKILVAGASSNGTNTDFALVRYNTDGSLDTGLSDTTEIATAGNDTLTGGLTNLDGGSGIDTVTYSTARTSHTVTNSSNGYTVSGFNLTNIERLHFTDVNLALDVTGNAGTTAKILGAVFGAASVSNTAYVGIGLSYLDNGMSYPDLLLLALNARLGAGFSNAAEVNLLYQNLVGSLPSVADLDYWTGTLTSGQFTQASLAVTAADLDLNTTNINLVGLAQVGIEYV
ncbi:MAG: hypothetical protein Q8O25_02930 [Sulfurisoma sp.]|nr:hypothetical protein [Sulfurisoma sp.]